MNVMMNHFFETLEDLYFRGDLRKLEQFLVKSKNEFEKKDVQCALIVYNELGSFYRGIGQYMQSAEEFSEAAKIVEKEYGKNAQYATILNNMAGSYRMLNNYDKVIELFQEAADIYQENGMDDSYEYTSMLNNMGLVYRQMGENEKAVEALRGALHRLQKMPECQQERATTYNNIMALHFAMGKRDQAMYCATRALQEYTKCPDHEKIHFVAGLTSMGALLYTEGLYDQSLSAYNKAQKQIYRYYGENEEYANIIMNMYWVYIAMNDMANASFMLKKAYEINKKVFGFEHEKTQMTEDLLKRFQVNCQTV